MVINCIDGRASESGRYLRKIEMFGLVREDVRGVTVQGNARPLTSVVSVYYNEVLQHLRCLRDDNWEMRGCLPDYRTREDYEGFENKFFKRYAPSEGVLKRLEKISRREPVKKSQMEYLIRILLFHTQHYLGKSHNLHRGSGCF